MVVGSFLFIVLLLELVIFRFVLIASDWPRLEYRDSMLKYRPDQIGIYRVRNEIKAQYRINKSGWNSRHPRYDTAKPDNIFRIAIIGDSYVEAFQVDFDQSLAAVLEQKLADKVPTQVFSFGLSGAPLSQYLHILREEVLRFAPDLVVVVLVHNDFDESYLPVAGVYTNSFMKIQLGSNGQSQEIAPQAFERKWYHYIRNSATWRYLARRQQVRFQALRAVFFKSDSGNPSAPERPPEYQANIDISALDVKMGDNTRVADYCFRQLKHACDDNNIRLLLVIDGDRNAIYTSVDNAASNDTKALQINHMVHTVAGKYDIDILDLHPIFAKDYKTNRRLFNFNSDGHWNHYGHQVAAGAIADILNTSSP